MKRKFLALILISSFSFTLTACGFGEIGETIDKVSTGIQTVEKVSNMVENFDGVEDIAGVVDELENLGVVLDSSENVNDIDRNDSIDEQLGDGLEVLKDLGNIINSETGKNIDSEDLSSLLNTLQEFEGALEGVKDVDSSKDGDLSDLLNTLGGLSGVVSDSENGKNLEGEDLENLLGTLKDLSGAVEDSEAIKDNSSANKEQLDAINNFLKESGKLFGNYTDGEKFNDMLDRMDNGDRSDIDNVLESLGDMLQTLDPEQLEEINKSLSEQK